ncbi:MAG: hypothetical protein N3H31_04070 [Candidatus Nezhaarchaeota archaeon]|nr:hypothetical protein [Candidatus Nezhaarchaeota archaeon]
MIDRLLSQSSPSPVKLSQAGASEVAKRAEDKVVAVPELAASLIGADAVAAHGVSNQPLRRRDRPLPGLPYLWEGPIGCVVRQTTPRCTTQGDARSSEV